MKWRVSFSEPGLLSFRFRVSAAGKGFLGLTTGAAGGADAVSVISAFWLMAMTMGPAQCDAASLAGRQGEGKWKFGGENSHWTADTPPVRQSGDLNQKTSERHTTRITNTFTIRGLTPRCS